MLENDSSDQPLMARASYASWPRALRLALWGLPFAVGIGLRSRGLARQVLIGDERWEIAAALARPFPELFQHFLVSGANYSPPLGCSRVNSLSGRPSGSAEFCSSLGCRSFCGIDCLSISSIPSPGCWRSRRNSSSTRAWCGATSPLSFLEPS